MFWGRLNASQRDIGNESATSDDLRDVYLSPDGGEACTEPGRAVTVRVSLGVFQVDRGHSDKVLQGKV